MVQANQWACAREDAGRQDTTHQARILTPVKARQGIVSGRVRLILAVSLTLVVVAFAIIYSAET
jgi:hypothetical protein